MPEDPLSPVQLAFILNTESFAVVLFFTLLQVGEKTELRVNLLIPSGHYRSC